MADAGPMVDDLHAESDVLDALVSPLPAVRWSTPTPAAGWTIAHQIAHLLWTDRVALLSIVDEPAFGTALTAAAADPTGFVDAAAEELAATPAAELLADWRSTRARLHEELRAVPEDRRLLWFGPPMSAASMATARLMETWAHGLDVADALGVPPAPTVRLRSIAHLGVRTRDFAFGVHGLTPPTEPFYVELWADRRHLDLGSGRRGAAGDGFRPGFLCAGHSASGERRARCGCRRAGCAALVADRAGVRGAARRGSMSARAKRARAINASAGR